MSSKIDPNHSLYLKYDMNANTTDLKNLTRDQLTAWLATRGIASYRATQIMKWVYLRQMDRFEEMTDLGKPLRALLPDYFTIDRLHRVQTETSRDGAIKYLFELHDDRCIESVLIPEKNHYTICISTQAGCAQGCRFCLTARGGFRRNLTPGEIVGQVRDIARDIAADDPLRLTNIVFMGMGEPLANYDNLVRAIDILTDQQAGMQFSPRRVTVSTAGLVPEIYRLGHDTEINLAVSLNAADNKTRNRIMPVNRRYPVEELIRACQAYPLKNRRRITIEYILMKGINDTPEDAGKLARLLRPVRSKINLIPFNEHAESEFRRPDEETVSRFQEVLHHHNYTAVIRHSKGQDISAACGQLSARMPER